MTDTQLYWLFYAFFLAVRIPSNVKRCRIPLMRGPGYFFNTRVPDDFFAGPGRDVLRRYRLWIFVPFLFDLAALPLIYRSGHPIYLIWLAVADTVLAVMNHMAALKRAIREVKPYEIEAVPAPSAVAYSLIRRRLRDYTAIPLEVAIGALNLGALLLIARGGWGAALGAFVLFYLQAGLLLLKCALIAGRTALPQEGAEQYLAWREAYRRLLTNSCDAVRFMIAATVLIAFFDLDRTRIAIGFAVVLGAWTLWYWRRLRGFMQLYTTTRPVKLPGALQPEASAPPVLCYRPATPLSFVKGPRGWALNLASRRTKIGIAYLTGLAALLLVAASA